MSTVLRVQGSNHTSSFFSISSISQPHSKFELSLKQEIKFGEEITDNINS